MNALILYDDSGIAARANALLHHAARQAQEALPWSIKPWRFDMLLRPLWAEQALKEAAQAHLIVFAVRRQLRFPSALLGWLEQWAGQREVQGAALAVFDGESGDTLSELRAPALSRFVRRHGLSVIVGETEPDAEDIAKAGQEPREQTPTDSPDASQARKAAARHHFYGGGINE